MGYRPLAGKCYTNPILTHSLEEARPWTRTWSKRSASSGPHGRPAACVFLRTQEDTHGRPAACVFLRTQEDASLPKRAPLQGAASKVMVQIGISMRWICEKIEEIFRKGFKGPKTPPMFASLTSRRPRRDSSFPFLESLSWCPYVYHPFWRNPANRTGMDLLVRAP